MLEDFVESWTAVRPPKCKEQTVTHVAPAPLGHRRGAVLCCGSKMLRAVIPALLLSMAPDRCLVSFKFSSTFSYNFCLLSWFSSSLSVVLSHRLLHASLCQPYALDIVNLWKDHTLILELEDQTTRLTKLRCRVRVDSRGV